jgi:L-iditol 2-dehydrogenase
MKANVLYGINDLRYVDVDRPVLKADEVLVQVHAAGICGSDITRVLTSGTYHFPTIIGHEFSGKIAVTNAGDEHLQGKRVAVYPLIPCKQCTACKQEQYELCSNYNYLGSRCDGGFAEYVAVPKWNLAFIPDSISFEDAAMIEPAAVALHALCMAELKQGDAIAVIGPGTIGMLIAQLSMIYGARKVMLIGRSQQKLDFASKTGIENTCNSTLCNVPEWIAEQTGGKNADIVIEGTGAAASLVMALDVVKPSGVVVAMGNPVDDMHLSKIDYWKLLRKQLVVRGIWNSTYGIPGSNWERIIALIEEQKLKPSSLITDRLPLSGLLDGIYMMKNQNRYTNKVMITI